jgi:glucan phosphoethanolaminetransferase (alkaline phosphatase superfamily)
MLSHFFLWYDSGEKSLPNLNDFYNTIFRFKQWKSEAARNWTFHGEPSTDPKYDIIPEDENSHKINGTSVIFILFGKKAIGESQNRQVWSFFGFEREMSILLTSRRS